LSPQRNIAHYRITAKLGEGGMGEVWRATDTKLSRDVAIKILPETFAADPDRFARFTRESQVLASLNHPNIAAIYGVEERALVMELVEGPTLAERIAQGPIPLDEALDIARQIGEALEAAHEKGIVHRDLKPANIKITPDGRVKVLDFGLAKALAGDPVSGDPANSPTLTMRATVAGVILGTAAYMAPEQAKGKAVDKRADIWAFGVVLYEMVTGSQLFAGDSIAEVLGSVLKDQPDLSAAPAPVRRLLARCLERDLRKRLRDIGDYADLLEQPAAAPAPPRAASPFPWLLAAAAALAALAAIGWIFFHPAPLPLVTRFEITAPPGSTLPPGTPAVSPDGRTLAYVVRDADGIPRIHVRALDSIASRALPGTERAIHPFWSPDGRSLAFSADRVLKRIDLAGGAPLALTPISGPWHGAWSQAGIILGLMASGLVQVPAEGGPVRPVEMAGRMTGLSFGFPFFLSDGRRFLGRVDADGGANIELAALGSAEHKLVLPDVGSAPILAPTPNGKVYLLYLREASLVAQAFDEKTATAAGNPFAVADAVGRVASPQSLPTVGVSPAGVLAYQTAGDAHNNRLQWFDRSGKPLGQVAAESDGFDFQLSPDGRSVAMVRSTPVTADIWIADLVRGSSTRFTFGTNGKGYAAAIWSPDGKRIAYHRAGGGIYVKDANGTGIEQKLTESSAFPLAWSPDGAQIAFFQDGRLFLLPLDGAAPVPLGAAANFSLSGTALSPDGKYIAFSTRESGRDEIYVQALPPATGKWQISVAGGSQPRWRRDGRELFFLAPDSRLMAVDIQTHPAISAGVPQALFQAAAPRGGPGFRSFDVSSDGRRFLVASLPPNTENNPITVVLNWWIGLRDK
jgi:eukaryotic-like serine/threonine-protein kinase